MRSTSYLAVFLLVSGNREDAKIHINDLTSANADDTEKYNYYDVLAYIRCRGAHTSIGTFPRSLEPCTESNAIVNVQTKPSISPDPFFLATRLSSNDDLTGKHPPAQ